jgi:hypothetical protein
MVVKKVVAKQPEVIETVDNVVNDVNDVVDTVDVEDDTVISDEDLQAEQLTAKEKVQAKLAEKKLGSKDADTKDSYSRAETEDLIQQAIAKFAKKQQLDMDEDDVYDPSKPRKFTIVVPRLNNKWVVGFENMANDPYNPGAVIKSIDLTRTDKTTGKSIVEPWVKLIYKDQAETDTVDYPFSYVLKNSSKVECELVERKKVDTSYDFGLIKETEVKDYDKQYKDTFIKAKVTQYKETFVVRDPITGDTFEVLPDVINWEQVKKINQ